MQTEHPKKLRIWRLLAGKTLNQIATGLRLPAYIVSAIERGDIEPSPRWVLRFEEVYGAAAAAELLRPVDTAETLGPVIGRLKK
jgi:transcriptional regulator with XRE-family HTH domain